MLFLKFSKIWQCLQNENAEWVYSIDMTCSMDMPCIMDKQRVDMQHGDMDVQHKYRAWTCSMDIKQGHAACYMQFGHVAWTCRMDTGT
jgi:hypothetical protein